MQQIAQGPLLWSWLSLYGLLRTAPSCTSVYLAADLVFVVSADMPTHCYLPQVS
jgi:hypothetical protein